MRAICRLIIVGQVIHVPQLHRSSSKTKMRMVKPNEVHDMYEHVENLVSEFSSLFD